MHTLLHSVPPTLQQASTDPHLRQRLLNTHGQVWVTLLWVTAPFSLVLGHTRCTHKHPFVCALQKSVSPVLCKFWGLHGGVDGNLLQKGLCHTQVYCTQSPCCSPLQTHTSAGESQTQSGSSFVACLGPGMHNDCLSPLSVSGKYGVRF